jgi:hypothetical protein
MQNESALLLLAFFRSSVVFTKNRSLQEHISNFPKCHSGNCVFSRFTIHTQKQNQAGRMAGTLRSRNFTLKGNHTL